MQPGHLAARHGPISTALADPGASGPTPLVRAASRISSMDTPPSTDLDVSLTSDFPVGAGLGGSSAAGVALAAALHRAHGNSTPRPAMLAEWSRAVEVEELGIAGGRQDHYAAAYGGALGLHIRRADHGRAIGRSPRHAPARSNAAACLPIPASHGFPPRRSRRCSTPIGARASRGRCARSHGRAGAPMRDALRGRRRRRPRRAGG